MGGQGQGAPAQKSSSPHCGQCQTVCPLPTGYPLEYEIPGSLPESLSFPYVFSGDGGRHTDPGRNLESPHFLLSQMQYVLGMASHDLLPAVQPAGALGVAGRPGRGSLGQADESRVQQCGPQGSPLHPAIPPLTPSTRRPPV